MWWFLSYFQDKVLFYEVLKSFLSALFTVTGTARFQDGGLKLNCQLIFKLKEKRREQPVGSAIVNNRSKRKPVCTAFCFLL